MNSFLQMFKTIAMFFGLIQKTISTVDHCVSMLDETAEAAHAKLTLTNGEELRQLRAELAAQRTPVAPAPKTKTKAKAKAKG